MSTLYLDSSAITKLVVDEAESDALRLRVAGQEVVSSRVAVVEVMKAVARANPQADPQRVLRSFAFIELDAELARLAGGTGEASVRALDALHIASALRLGRQLDAFVTYDVRQSGVASALGLAVETPAAKP